MVNDVFAKYDVDRSGTLDVREVKSMLNDSLKSMGQSRKVTESEVNQFIKGCDKNEDGKITKAELAYIFRGLTGQH